MRVVHCSAPLTRYNASKNPYQGIVCMYLMLVQIRVMRYTRPGKSVRRKNRTKVSCVCVFFCFSSPVRIHVFYTEVGDKKEPFFPAFFSIIIYNLFFSFFLSSIYYCIYITFNILIKYYHHLISSSSLPAYVESLTFLWLIF